MLLSIIIVNYNVYDLLINCLNSLQKYIDCDHEIFVVDNNSAIRNIEKINTEFPYVKFIQSKSNIGFGAANNLGANFAIGKYLLLLNPDTIITESIFSRLIEYLEKNTDTSICAPKLLYQNGAYQVSSGFFSGLMLELFEALFLINIARYFEKIKLTKSKQPVIVKWVSAACLIIKKDIFNELNGFNEKYFLNYEDIDLCKRVTNMNYKIAYFGNLSSIHLDHKSFESNYELLIYSRYLSRLVFAKEHYSLIRRNISRIIQIIGLIPRIIIVNLPYNKNEMAARRKGYIKAFLFYSGIKKIV
ncbi:MAG: glycosyltransferase family 2 protein [Ignavibacteria bacterium]|nr:glycosyltransferase family 2 protein [Ignavibacteria bacterium]